MAELMLLNPSSRGRRKAPVRRKRARTRTAVRALPRRRVGRRRRNPIRLSGITDQFISGAIGAGGALAVDVVMSKVPLPAAFTASPVMTALTKGGIGIAIGMAVSKMGRNRALGTKLANGAITIGLYNAGKATVGPALGLAGSDEGLLGYDTGLLGYSDFNDLGYQGVAPMSEWNDEMNGYSEF